MIPVALRDGAVSSLAVPYYSWLSSQPGRELLLRWPAFGAWLFTNLLPIGTREHIAGFTLKNDADLLQRFKINS